MAHKDLKSGGVPVLDGAIQTVYVFDNAMREKYETEWLDERFNDLNGTHEAFKLRIRDYLKSLAQNGTSYLYVE